MVLGGFRSFHVLVTTPLQLSRPFGQLGSRFSLSERKSNPSQTFGGPSFLPCYE